MKVLGRVLLALAVLWSLAWWGMSTMVRNSVADWFDDRAAEGWQADYADLSTSGFPLSIITEMTSPALADPATGTAWEADGLTMESPGIWPGTVTMRFAPTPQRLSYFDQTVILTGEALAAALDLRPGRALELRHMGLTSGPMQIEEEAGALAGADALRVEMTQGAQNTDYMFDIAADRFVPGARLRRLLQGSDTLPDALDTLALRMAVGFDRPWDRRALEDRRPQPRRIDLALADAQWGPMRLQAAGGVDVDDAGIPTGELTIKAENWQDMLALAGASGALSPDLVATADRTLSLLAGIGGNPNALDVTLTFRDGLVTLGFLPLGPAPRLILR